jgi:anti-sigma regulatory factor (Ser/Thr protein kinase)
VRHAAASAGQVRHRLVADLGRLGLAGELIEDAALLVSELVTNAVRYAHPLPGGTLLVSWEYVSGRLLLQVTDGGGRGHPGGRDHPQVRDAGPFDVRGRGLAIVEAIAAAWGIERSPNGGKTSSTVWAELAARAGRRSAARSGARPGPMGRLEPRRSTRDA